MTTGAVFHYLIPFSAHLIAFPSSLFDFIHQFLAPAEESSRYKKDADIHSTADIPGIFRKNIRQARLFILTSFSHSHIVIKNVS